MLGEVNNPPRGKGLLGLNNAPRGRGLLGLKNALKRMRIQFSPRPGTFLGRERSLEMVRNDICSYSTANEQNHINQYLTNNST